MRPFTIDAATRISQFADRLSLTDALSPSNRHRVQVSVKAIERGSTPPVLHDHVLTIARLALVVVDIHYVAIVDGNHRIGGVAAVCAVNPAGIHTHPKRRVDDALARSPGIAHEAVLTTLPRLRAPGPHEAQRS